MKSKIQKLFATIALTGFLIAMTGSINPAKADIETTYRKITYYFMGIKISEIYVCNLTPTDCLAEVIIQ